MIIETLEFKNFRNYRELFLQPDQGINVLYGDNAQGKTNILEGIFVCGTAKSHRGVRDAEMIRFGKEEAHICMKMRKEGIHHQIDIHLKKSRGKGAAIDGIPVKKASALYELLHLVLFSPEDLYMIKNGPGERRKFIDAELCQLDKVYLSVLSSYQKILQQRNKLLKDIQFAPSLLPTLDIWDEQMALCGEQIVRQRSSFLLELNQIVKEIHAELTGKKEKIEVVYEPNVKAGAFRKILQDGRKKDLMMRTSVFGPHRDDIRVMLDGVDIRHYGSQGQQRSAALSLKLSEIALIRQKTGDKPVLLLDDVLSELDRSRQKKLLGFIEDIQTFITCTGMDELIENQFSVQKVFHIVAGSYEEKDGK